MWGVIRYVTAAVLLGTAIALGVSGFIATVRQIADVRSHRRAAVRYTIATGCFLAAFELVYPSLIAVLIIAPVGLLNIWIQYWTAASLIRRREREAARHVDEMHAS